MKDLFSNPNTRIWSAIPDAPRLDLLLTANTAISHHDPAEQDDSNTQLFNRQLQLLPGRRAGERQPTQAQVDALCALLAVPETAADLFAELPLPQHLACAVLRTFLDLYNGGDGTGLFSGMSRYEIFEPRIRQAAVRAADLRSFWDCLCRGMQVPVQRMDATPGLLRLLLVPQALGQLALASLGREYRSLLSLAYLWHDEAKCLSPEYAKKAGRNLIEATWQPQHSATTLLGPEDEAALRLPVPAVSGNTCRHQIVREPGMRHLFRTLGLETAPAGRGPLPAGLEAMFYNGGNIASGAKQPSNPFKLAAQARFEHPLLDLLGGVTDSFDLGESRLKVGCWLVCRENREALPEAVRERPTATVSAFDLLDEVTLTRQALDREEFAGPKDGGQMLFSFQTLCAGAELLVRFTLLPGTGDLTAGALWASLQTYLGDCPVLGGQHARGFGHVRGEVLPGGLDWAARGAAYEDYLRERREELRDGLTGGTLGTDAVLCKL